MPSPNRAIQVRIPSQTGGASIRLGSLHWHRSHSLFFSPLRQRQFYYWVGPLPPRHSVRQKGSPGRPYLAPHDTTGGSHAGPRSVGNWSLLSCQRRVRRVSLSGAVLTGTRVIASRHIPCYSFTSHPVGMRVSGSVSSPCLVRLSSGTWLRRARRGLGPAQALVQVRAKGHGQPGGTVVGIAPVEDIVSEKDEQDGGKLAAQ